MMQRAEPADEVFPLWSDTENQAAYSAEVDRTAYPWRPRPVVPDADHYTAHIRLGRAVGFVPGLLPELTLIGISVVHVPDLSPSEVLLAWSDAMTSRHIACFVRHITPSPTA
ncbi:hypothetical protein [Streptomyces sp. NPDC101181]|uniref:hypothetical protein n=1 Tax=Streptomyces sp. NPDC101181 TaxID=3366125 RepID=UPI0038128561